MFTLLNIPISTLTLEQSLEQVAEWALAKQTRTVTFCNAHVLALSTRDERFRQVLLNMDLNCPDGKPLVWTGRIFERQKTLTQVAGPDFMPLFLSKTAGTGLRHYFYGTRPEVLQNLNEILRKSLPDVEVAGSFSPPFGPISDEDFEAHCDAIRRSGADVVWVCLGCPKQEIWVQRARTLLPGKTLLAVGQALDIMAGDVSRAPESMRKLGLEWFYRLLVSPRRLWKRYLVYNVIFLHQVSMEHLFRTPRSAR